MRDYKAEWRVRIRKWAIAELGGHCAICQSIEDLQFDHVDPLAKTIEISVAVANCWAKARIAEELKKCQLLCKKHHMEKSAVEGSVDHGGGISGKRNCKCRPCRDKFNEYMRAWKREKRKAGII